MTKAFKGYDVFVGEVIPVLKRLRYQIEHVQGEGIRTLQSEVLVQIDRFVLSSCLFRVFTYSWSYYLE